MERNQVNNKQNGFPTDNIRKVVVERRMDEIRKLLRLTEGRIILSTIYDAAFIGITATALVMRFRMPNVIPDDLGGPNLFIGGAAVAATVATVLTVKLIKGIKVYSEYKAEMASQEESLKRLKLS